MRLEIVCKPYGFPSSVKIILSLLLLHALSHVKLQMDVVLKKSTLCRTSLLNILFSGFLNEASLEISPEFKSL